VTEDRPSPEQEVRRLYEEAESRMAKAAERLVASDSFGELLSMATENVVAVTRIGFDVLDTVWSNLRLAGRRDLTRVGQRIGRAEDKLELVLQEVERLRESLETAPAPPARGGNSNADSGRRQPARRPRRSSSS
jgi:hypothetical protein